MRKRRRLANKMTIMVCAVLIAVSAFFYAPMDVNASSSSATVESTSTSSGKFYYVNFPTTQVCSIDFQDYLDIFIDSDSFYKITFDSSLDISASRATKLRRHFLTYKVFGSEQNTVDYIYNYIRHPDGDTSNIKTFSSFQSSCFIYAKGSELDNVLVYFDGLGLHDGSSGVSTSLTLTHSISNVSVESISSTDADALEDAYSSGYSDGFNEGSAVGNDIGFSSRYASGYYNGFNEGHLSGYNDGFAAGKDSLVDDSFYDIGFQAGYIEGYSEGYDEGYEVGYQLGLEAGETIGYEKGFDEGYQSFKDRIDGWGADTNDYPLLVFDDSLSDFSFLVHCQSNVPSTCYGYLPLFDLDFEINPTHTYKLVFNSDGFYNSAHNCRFSTSDLGFVVGDSRFSISAGSGTYEYYLPGDVFASSVILDSYVYGMAYYDSSANSSDLEFKTGQVTVGIHGDVSLMVFDMGPSGDTQNHIANQTDNLTNGFDNSQGNSVNSDLSSGLNEYQTSEDNLWATATTGLKDFTFFDFASVPAMITGMSFITAIMGSWFNQAGGTSGVGIVLSILFSVVLVAMVLGLYRWYQSRGGKD